MSRILIQRKPGAKHPDHKILEGEVENNCKFIWLNPRVHAIVDIENYEYLSQFHWRMKKSGHCWYACRRVKKDGQVYYIRMHREVMHTPDGYECHHVNKRTLDNRKANLMNLTADEHMSIHLIC